MVVALWWPFDGTVLVSVLPSIPNFMVLALQEAMVKPTQDSLPICRDKPGSEANESQ